MCLGRKACGLVGRQPCTACPEKPGCTRRSKQNINSATVNQVSGGRHSNSALACAMRKQPPPRAYGTNACPNPKAPACRSAQQNGPLACCLIHQPTANENCDWHSSRSRPCLLLHMHTGWRDGKTQNSRRPHSHSPRVPKLACLRLLLGGKLQMATAVLNVRACGFRAQPGTLKTHVDAHTIPSGRCVLRQADLGWLACLKLACRNNRQLSCPSLPPSGRLSKQTRPARLCWCHRHHEPCPRRRGRPRAP